MAVLTRFLYGESVFSLSQWYQPAESPASRPPIRAMTEDLIRPRIPIPRLTTENRASQSPLLALLGNVWEHDSLRDAVKSLG